MGRITLTPLMPLTDADIKFLEYESLATLFICRHMGRLYDQEQQDHRDEQAAVQMDRLYRRLERPRKKIRYIN